MKYPYVFIRILALATFFLNSFFYASAQSPSDVKAYISKYKNIALEQEVKYGIPAPITLAQGILESGAGKSVLARKANNHFGIKKGYTWNGPLFYAWDDETRKSAFRIYSSDKESYNDHSRFLKNNSRYNTLFTKSVYDYRSWAWGLQNSGYATAKDYAKALIGYIEAYKLYTINGGVKLRPGKTVTITRYIKNNIPVFDTDCKMEDSELTEEEKNINTKLKRFAVEINNIRCTILYPGETLSSVSQKYNIPQSKLLEFNEINNENSLNEGDIIFLNKKKSKYKGSQDFYTVKTDETLYEISQKFGIKIADLANMNNINIFTTLERGKRIRLK